MLTTWATNRIVNTQITNLAIYLCNSLLKFISRHCIQPQKVTKIFPREWILILSQLPFNFFLKMKANHVFYLYLNTQFFSRKRTQSFNSSEARSLYRCNENENKFFSQPT